MTFYGGPLDGETYSGPDLNQDKPYIVFECMVDGKPSDLLAMYCLKDGQLHFVRTKTKQALFAEGGIGA